MWLSSTAQSALRAVLHLAASGELAPLHAGEIASAVGAPRNYLSKILHQLARAGVLTSRRGPGGGFALAGPAAALTLERVTAPFAPSDDRRCLLGRVGCGHVAPCPAHEVWSAVAGEVERFLATTTVADLLNKPLPHASLSPPRILEDLAHARATR